MSKYDECMNIPENASKLLFNELDRIMLLIIKIDVDQQEIVDHVDNYIEKMCPPEINDTGIYSHLIDEIIEGKM